MRYNSTWRARRKGESQIEMKMFPLEWKTLWHSFPLKVEKVFHYQWKAGGLYRAIRGECYSIEPFPFSALRLLKTVWRIEMPQVT
jgi:hypothetical protein